MASEFRWLKTGQEAYGQMLAAIQAAVSSVRLETYIYRDDAVGRRALDELIAACRRGVKVKVLVDAFGSVELRDSFWNPLRAEGAEVRWFNPIDVNRFAFRDHRKIFVCDERVAFIGGFNIGDEYAHDGVSAGWRDLGMRIDGVAALDFARAVDRMFDLAGQPHGLLGSFRTRLRRVDHLDERSLLFLTAPGFGRTPFKTMLHADLHRARDVFIASAYYLPTARLRRDLRRVVKRGGQVQLLLPGKSDVPLMQTASRSLYRRMLRAGLKIAEYQPQILHTKMIVVDDIVYVGSLNLDTRSLHINFEVMVRIEDARLAAEGRQILAGDLEHALAIELEAWNRSRTWWQRLRGQIAFYVLFRLDALVASRQLRRLLGMGTPSTQ